MVPNSGRVCERQKVEGFTRHRERATTVTERWVQENLQHANPLPLTQVTLKAGNGLEILYNEVILVELKPLGQTLQRVPVLVVRVK